MFNKRDYKAAESFWSPNYIQHIAHIPPGREGLIGLIKSVPAALFAEDGAVELPFLHSLGIPGLHRGRQAISELQDSLAGLYLDFAFKPEDTHVLIDTPEQGVTFQDGHRILLATSSSRASQPQIRPNVCGSVVRSWPQAEHVKTKVY